MLEALKAHLTDAEAKFVLKPSANLVNEGVNEREEVVKGVGGRMADE